MDEKSDFLWAEIEKLPIVLRHGDFFPPNIFYVDDKIVLIDWDSAGWSYFGEDIVGLIADAVAYVGSIDNVVENYHKCVPAYLRGFSEFSDTPQIKNPYIYERIVMHHSYMLVDEFNWRNEAKTSEEMKLDLDVLQKIYEIGVSLNL